MPKKQSLATALQTFDRTQNSATAVSDPALESRPRLKAQAPSRRGKKGTHRLFRPQRLEATQAARPRRGQHHSAAARRGTRLALSSAREAPDRASTKNLNRCWVGPRPREHEDDRGAAAIDGSVEVAPTALDTNVGLIDTQDLWVGLRYRRSRSSSSRP